ncbi:MAG: hypothetical protein ABI910_10730 [Gemmatimonadota bacterium]
MRTSLVHILVPLAMVAAACGGGTSQTAQLSDDLKQDLAAASAPKLELASGAGDYKPMRFVSELEQTNASTPMARASSPRPVRQPAPTPSPQQESPAEAPPAVQEQAQVAVTPPQGEPDATVSAVPSVAPRPAALPVDVPSTGSIGERDGRGISRPGERGGDRGGDIGGIIGVVIRGGGVGDDHCVPHGRGGRRGGRFPFPINPMR